MHKRVDNLDLFRFIAITLVVYLHVGDRFIHSPNDNVISLGKYGVELFFVLSGFLIGNLYYKNYRKISLVKFWLQRFLRTYPPYLVTLVISYLAAKSAKNVNVDFGYLVFFQNFYNKLPFFNASWSLCVEEHFYVFFPLFILILTLTKSKNIKLFLWLSLCIIPTFLRYHYGDYNSTSFGYNTTASIFKFDGIAFGCLVAFLINNYTINIRSCSFYSLIFLFSFIAISYWLTLSNSHFKYTFGYFLLILNSTLLLISFYYSESFYVSKNKIVKRIAIMAYSIYLTHSLVLNVCEKIYLKLNIDNLSLKISTSLLFISLISYAFYLFIEKPSINLRDKILSIDKRKPE